MFISYRRTGGVLALLTFAAVALAATVFTAVVGATVLVVALVVAAITSVARAVLPARPGHHTVRPPTAWPDETFEATVVDTTALSEGGDLVRLDSDKVDRARRR
jgi:hypothetical protein